MKKGWEYKKLGDVALFVNGDRGVNYPSRKDFIEEGIPFINAGNLKDTSIDISGINYICEEKYNNLSQGKFVENDILFCLRGTLGKHAIVQNGLYGAIASSLVIIRVNEKCINKYISYYLDSKQPTIEKMNNGAAQPNIPAKTMKEFLIPVPPLSEQSSIVSYLDSAFAKIDALKSNAEKELEEAKALFQSALKEMMTPKEGWEEKTLGEVGDIFGRIGFRGYTRNDLVDGPDNGAITLSPSNIQNGKMDYSSCTYISWFKYEESPEIMIHNGDVLIVKTGSSYGKSALVENLPHEATINPQSVVIKNIKINNRFFAYLIQTPWIQKEFTGFVSGTAIPTFSQAKLSQVILRYPNIKEQNIIVQKLGEIEENISSLQSNYSQIISECSALKQAILREVFE